MPTNIKESGLESLIVNHLVNVIGYELGESKDYDRAHAVDVPRLFRFLESTQPDEFAKIGADSELGRQKFLDRVQGEIAKRGIVDVLRKGVQAYPARFDFFYQLPSEKNSAGSGKSNSIAWLAHQLVGLQKDGKAVMDLFLHGAERDKLDPYLDQCAENDKSSLAQYMLTLR